PQQQRSQPGLLREGGVRPEDPQVLPLVEPEDRQVGVVGLDEQQRHVRVGVDVAQPVRHLLDVGDAGEIEVGHAPAVLAPHRRRTRRNVRPWGPPLVYLPCCYPTTTAHHSGPSAVTLHRHATVPATVASATATVTATPTATPRSPSRASATAASAATAPAQIVHHARAARLWPSSANRITHTPAAAIPDRTDRARTGCGSRYVGRGGAEGNRPDGVVPSWPARAGVWASTTVGYDRAGARRRGSRRCGKLPA